MQPYQQQPVQQVHVNVTIQRRPGCLVWLGRSTWALMYWTLVFWWWLPMKWLAIGAYRGARWLIARYGWRGWLIVAAIFVALVLFGNVVGSSH